MEKIVYIGKTNCSIEKETDVRPGQKIEVTKHQYDNLIQDRHWVSPEEYAKYKKARDLRSIARQKKKPKKFKEVKT